jgi:hypothetical protein
VVPQRREKLVLGGWGKRDVLVRVAAAERPKAPVSLYSGEGRVVRVVSRVDCPARTFRDGTSEKHREDVVVDRVGLGLVEGKEDQRTVVVEVGIVEQRGEPEIDPAARKVDGGVVAIVDHVGRHPHPLGQSRGIGIDGKVVEVANSRPASGIRGDRIVDDARVVFALVKGIIRRRSVEVINGREAILIGMSKTMRQSMARAYFNPSKPSVGRFSW